MASGLPISKTSPAFLHANSTSHTWIFSAIAELVDNAYDPDVNARQLLISKQSIQNEICLTFVDNGNGLTADRLHKMLSFGYCDKVAVGNHKPVGHYGNGFKSGSMRLGKDAIVFTRQKDTMSVGLLSQSFLAAVNAETVVVPIVSYNAITKARLPVQQGQKSLKAIITHSLYKSEQAILRELEDMKDVLQGSQSGTKIVIYSLKRNNNNRLELDFESDPYDIINPENAEFDESNIRMVVERVPEYRRSLREYLSILFLKPRMKIMLRGKKVKTKLVSKSLSRTEKDVYKPSWLNGKMISITFGFSPNKDDYGVLIYNKNRLIKAYEHVGCQRSSGGMEKKGVGVVGIVELDFLEPIHNKQDFNKTDRYNATINAIGNKLTEYWTTKTNQVVTMGGVTIIEPTSMGLPDWTWVQCDNCLKWRRLIDGSSDLELPEKWFCYLNRDPIHNRCEDEEEPEDEDELVLRGRATYEKTGKKIVKEEKRRRGQSLDKREEELRRQAELLKQKEQQLNTPLRQHMPGASNQPTLRDFELAQKQLEESKRREREQQALIARLQAQAPPAVSPVTAGTSRRSGPVGNKRSAPPPAPNNKNGGPGPSSAKKSKTTPVMQNENFVVTRNESSGSDDDVIMIDADEVDNWRKRKKGKLPVFGRRQHPDDDDVKPDVSELNAAMNITSTSSGDENRANANKRNAASKNSSLPSTSKTVQNKENRITNPSNIASKSQNPPSTSKAKQNHLPSANKDVISKHAQQKQQHGGANPVTVAAMDNSVHMALPRLPDPVVITPTESVANSPLTIGDDTFGQTAPVSKSSTSSLKKNTTNSKSNTLSSSNNTAASAMPPPPTVREHEPNTSPTPSTRHVPQLTTTSTQTDDSGHVETEESNTILRLEKQLEKTRHKLLKLQTNVCELMKVIVPDVKVDNISHVDEIVERIIEANSSTDQPSTSKTAQDPKTEIKTEEEGEDIGGSGSSESTQAKETKDDGTKGTEVSQEKDSYTDEKHNNGASEHGTNEVAGSSDAVDSNEKHPIDKNVQGTNNRPQQSELSETNFAHKESNDISLQSENIFNGKISQKVANAEQKNTCVPDAQQNGLKPMDAEESSYGKGTDNDNSHIIATKGVATNNLSSKTQCDNSSSEHSPSEVPPLSKASSITGSQVTPTIPEEEIKTEEEIS